MNHRVVLPGTGHRRPPPREGVRRGGGRFASAKWLVLDRVLDRSEQRRKLDTEQVDGNDDGNGDTASNQDVLDGRDTGRVRCELPDFLG